MDNINYKIGNKLFTIRTQKLITQQAVADKMGISLSQYSRIERGTVHITVENLISAAKALGVSAAWLIDDTDNLDGFSYGESSSIELYKQFLISIRDKTDLCD